MTAVKRGDLLRALARWDPAIRLILLAGPDESGSRDVAAAALKALADPADPMAVTDLTPDELRADPGRLADEAASVSMFGGARVIRVAGAADGLAEAVRLLLTAPAAGNPVVLVAGDLGRASSLRKLAEESPAALALTSYPLAAQDMERWLGEEARGLGLQLEPGVAGRLVATSESDTGILASELRKFALFLDAAPDAPRRLERSHLALLGADSAEEDMNRLVSAVIAADHRATERQLRLLAGSSAIPALRAVARRLMQLMEARAAVDRGADAREAVKALRPPIFWKEADVVIANLRHWPLPRIRDGLAAMLRGEQAIKSANGPGDAAGWHLILSLGMARESA